MLSANSAFQMSQHSANVHSAEKLNQEITLAETRIANATTYNVFNIVYQAHLIGNPIGDPDVDSNLTVEQLAFRDALHDSGYVVGQDPVTGYWTINWSAQGPEQNVIVYQINTTVVPGPVQAQTIAAINAFFAAQIPSVTDNVLIAASAISGTYVHLVLVHQQDTQNLSSALQTALNASGLGYSNGNTTVSKRS